MSKQFRVTVNNKQYDVVVEELGAGAAPAGAHAAPSITGAGSSITADSSHISHSSYTFAFAAGAAPHFSASFAPAPKSLCFAFFGFG